MTNNDLNALLDLRFSSQTQLFKIDIEANKLREEVEYQPLWWKQSRLAELIKLSQKLRNIIYGIDSRLNQIQRIAA